MRPVDHTINYIELPMTDAGATKAFYGDLFGWTFTDWGPDYISFAGAGIDGGFRLDAALPVSPPGVLVVLYATDLEATMAAIEAAGGRVSAGIVEFPGGRRFQFRDPNGNELAVWSET
jgi:predicted enzyme related to lactoylglutathione lyase